MATRESDSVSLRKTAQSRLIVEIEDDGESIELDDGSTWQVIAGGVSRAILWLPTQRVQVSGGVGGPYTIHNQTTGDSIQAIKDG